MTERWLKVIAALLALQLVVAIVPGPFGQCERRNTGLREDGEIFRNQPVFVTDCVDSWWPVGADYISWMPATPVPLPTLGPGESPFLAP